MIAGIKWEPLYKLLSSMRSQLSSLEYSVSHATQTALYTQCLPGSATLCVKGQRGIFRLRVGCANTQQTSTTILPSLTQILSWHAFAAVKDFSGMLSETD